MTKAMPKQGFGICRNHYECEGACPEGIRVQFIARVNREFIRAQANGGRSNLLLGPFSA